MSSLSKSFTLFKMREPKRIENIIWQQYAEITKQFHFEFRRFPNNSSSRNSHFREKFLASKWQSCHNNSVA